MNILEHMLAQNLFRAERSEDPVAIELAGDLHNVGMRYWSFYGEHSGGLPPDSDPDIGRINDKWANNSFAYAQTLNYNYEYGVQHDGEVWIQTDPLRIKSADGKVYLTVRDLRRLLALAESRYPDNQK